MFGDKNILLPLVLDIKASGLQFLIQTVQHVRT